MPHLNHLGLPPELFRPILLLLDTKGLLCAALVCQGWSEEVCDVLWGSRLVPFKALLSLLGPIKQTVEDEKVYEVEFSIQDLSSLTKQRFLRRATSIRNVCLDTPLTIDSIVLVQEIAGTDPLLPRISSLQVLTCTSFVLTNMLQLVRGSKAKTVSVIDVARPGNPILNGEELMTGQPTLGFWFRLYQAIFRVEVLEFEAFMLIPCGVVFPQLRKITTRAGSFFTASLQTMALQPQLEDLTLEFGTYAQYSFVGRGLPARLPHLTKFSLALTRAPGPRRLLPDVAMPLLQVLDLQVPFGLDPFDLQILTERSPHVTEFNLLMGPTFTRELLTLLGRFENLTSLKLKSVRGFSLSKADLVTFLQAIPNVKELVMSIVATSAPHGVRPCPFIFDLVALASISKYCSSLETLILPFCVRAAQSTSRGYPNLKKLGFSSICGSSEEVPQAAKAIAKLFLYPGEVEIIEKEGDITPPHPEPGLVPLFSSALEDELRRIRLGSRDGRERREDWTIVQNGLSMLELD